MTIWDCQTHVRITSMTSSVERTDLDFKISVALVITFDDHQHIVYAQIKIIILTQFQFVAKSSKYQRII